MLACGIDIMELHEWSGPSPSRAALPGASLAAEVAVSRGAGELAARFAAKEAVSKALGVGIFGVTG